MGAEILSYGHMWLLKYMYTYREPDTMHIYLTTYLCIHEFSENKDIQDRTAVTPRSAAITRLSSCPFRDAAKIIIVVVVNLLVCQGIRRDSVRALNQKQRVGEFIDWRRGRGNKKQETQLFWLDWMQNVHGLQHAIKSTKFGYKPPVADSSMCCG